MTLNVSEWDEVQLDVVFSMILDSVLPLLFEPFSPELTLDPFWPNVEPTVLRLVDSVLPLLFDPFSPDLTLDPFWANVEPTVLRVVDSVLPLLFDPFSPELTLDPFWPNVTPTVFETFWLVLSFCGGGGNGSSPVIISIIRKLQLRHNWKLQILICTHLNTQ